MTEQHEYVVLRKPEVFVYRIPPRESNGHIAEGWKESIWKGRLQVVGKGDICVIRLLESNSEALFANCIVSKEIERAVERTIDSSRYFALRLDDGKGRHAFVGIGFSNRNDAFDFICAVNDFHQTQLPIEPLAPSKDSHNLALAEGQHVRIQLKNVPTKPRRTKDSSSSSTSLPSSLPSSLSLLPPPPPSSSTRRSPQKEKRGEKDSMREGDGKGSTSKKERGGLMKVEKEGKLKENQEVFDLAFGGFGENVGMEREIGKRIEGPMNLDDQDRKAHNVEVNEGKAVKQTDIWDAFSDEALQNWSVPSSGQQEQVRELSNNPFANEEEDDFNETSQQSNEKPSFYG